MTDKQIGVGVIGFGYWGPNMARNFQRRPECRLVAIADHDETRRNKATLDYPGTEVVENAEALIAHPDIAAVVIATPVSSHALLVEKALMAGKDVLVEKPMTVTSSEAEHLITLAKKEGRILAVDHTYLYNPAVCKLRDLVVSGELGDLIYLDSVRINLGLFQNDVNVIYDLAPHDLSIALFLIGSQPTSVRAMGLRYGLESTESLSYIHVEFEGGVVAHFHLSWISPVKLRRMIVAGSRKMAVYDDMEASEKIKVFDRGLETRTADSEEINQALIDYRIGDMWAPHISTREALDAEAENFLDCIKTRNTPLSNGCIGLTVIRLLEGCQKSLDGNGCLVHLETDQ
jgi:predicted dehydrogenase